MSDQQRPPSRVTLEDLLRLKRAERPPAEFWVDFERSLRAKQLAAIVERRPWWRSITRVPLSRWSLPLGGLAALMVALSTVGPAYHSSPSRTDVTHLELKPGTSRRLTPQPAALAPVVVETPEVLVTSTGPSPVSSSAATAPATVVSSIPAPSAEPVSAVSVAAVEAPASSHLASVTEQIAGIGLDPNTETEKSALPQFASMTRQDKSDAVEDLNAFFENAVAHLDSSMRSEKLVSIEPLSQVPSPRDARRARLLAFSGVLDTHAPQYSNSSNVIRSRDRIASHLSEEALYDSIRRLGIKNGGVSIQF